MKRLPWSHSFDPQLFFRFEQKTRQEKMMKKYPGEERPSIERYLLGLLVVRDEHLSFQLNRAFGKASSFLAKTFPHRTTSRTLGSDEISLPHVRLASSSTKWISASFFSSPSREKSIMSTEWLMFFERREESFNKFLKCEDKIIHF